jgi:hypothetical protein
MSSEPTTTYRFYPTVRQGYPPSTTFSKQNHTEGVPDGGKLQVDFRLSADGGQETASGDVPLRMYGPSDIVGIDPRQIVRTYPEPEETDLPPNYFAAIEFDAPGLPWLFSPVSDDDQGRALPWCGLVVLNQTEKTKVKPSGEGPLPTVKAPTSELPPVKEMWAWAHAQMVGGPADPSASAVRDEFSKSSTATRSRLISPRNLQPNKAYVAAVVPLFKGGQQAGQGNDPDRQTATDYAWTGDSGTVTLPVYHHWTFRTGKKGDFEYLVRQLEPRDLNGDSYDIGRREVDVTDPGPEALEVTATDPTGHRTAEIEGALGQRGTRPLSGYGKREALREMLNDTGMVTIEGEDYKVIGPPTYGNWHALEFTLEAPDDPSVQYPHGRDQWVYDLNLHPGYRVAAALGGQVVRERQEQLMASAWDQVGRIREANAELARAQLSAVVMRESAERLTSHPDGWRLQFTAPAHDRLLVGSGAAQETAGNNLRESDLPEAVLSAPFRRMLRPGGRLTRHLDRSLDTGRLADQLARGEIEIDTSPSQPDGMQTVGEEGEGLSLDELCGRAEETVSETEDVSYAEPVQETLDVIGAMRDHLNALSRLLRRLLLGRLPTRSMEDEERENLRARYDSQHQRLVSKFDILSGTTQTIVDMRDELDNVSSDFEPPVREDIIAQINRAISQLSLTSNGGILTRREVELGSTGLGSFRQIAKALDGLGRIAYYILAEEGTVARYVERLVCEAIPGERESVPPQVSEILNAFDPVATLLDRVNEHIGGIDLTSRPGAPFDRVMAYPKFHTPTSRDLKEMSEEFLLPGASEIPKNSVGALETNPEFIEAFMVGLNHEIAAELLWRRYPTDRRPSSFRQFWDPSARIPKPDDLDKLKDVTELHTWDDKTDSNDRLLDSPLGSNTMTGAGGADDGQEGQTSTVNSKVVLIIRGKLLERYPTATIYAAKARDVAQAADETRRVPKWPESTSDGVDTKFLRFPIFRGQLEPDVTFLGFDLSPQEATGKEATPSVANPNQDDNLGWFFAFEESPGEPRFGIDAATDVKKPPPGMTRKVNGSDKPRKVSNPEEGVEIGWRGLKWGHIPTSGSPSDLTNLTLEKSRPQKDEWRVIEGTKWTNASGYDPIGEEGAAKWGYNSAHLAYILWQKPVRVAMHADDLLPQQPEN